MNKRQGMTWRNAFIFHCFSSSIHKNKHNCVNSNFGLNKIGKHTKCVSKMLLSRHKTWTSLIISMGPTFSLYLKKKTTRSSQGNTHNFRTNETELQIIKSIILSGAGREREIWGYHKLLVNINLSEGKGSVSSFFAPNRVPVLFWVL